MSSNDVLVLLSVMLAVVVVAVLALALIEVRRGLTRHLRGPRGARRRAGRRRGRAPAPARAGAVKAINAQFDIILCAMPGIARKAAIVAERRPR